jgi:hypothetical protein
MDLEFYIVGIFQKLFIKDFGKITYFTEMGFCLILRVKNKYF